VRVLLLYSAETTLSKQKCCFL